MSLFIDDADDDDTNMHTDDEEVPIEIANKASTDDDFEPKASGIDDDDEDEDDEDEDEDDEDENDTEDFEEAAPPTPVKKPKTKKKKSTKKPKKKKKKMDKKKSKKSEGHVDGYEPYESEAEGEGDASPPHPPLACKQQPRCPTLTHQFNLTFRPQIHQNTRAH
ncbi:MAG: hypothetical protein NPIRA05_17210 [Nitrospirales bacterium]|nr:MAG: hypothetical protein NPIRA05_17210 [Nitrospirales bacterium]